MPKSSPPPKLNRAQSLDAVPVLNPAATIVPGEGGKLVVIVRRKRGTGWLARFQPAVMERRVKLDELGSFVLQQIDGRRSVRDIIAAFVAHYRVNRREAEMSCAAFMKSLMQRHVIVMAVD